MVIVLAAGTAALTMLVRGNVSERTPSYIITSLMVALSAYGFYQVQLTETSVLLVWHNIARAYLAMFGVLVFQFFLFNSPEFRAIFSRPILHGVLGAYALLVGILVLSGSVVVGTLPGDGMPEPVFSVWYPVLLFINSALMTLGLIIGFRQYLISTGRQRDRMYQLVSRSIGSMVLFFGVWSILALMGWDSTTSLEIAFLGSATVMLYAFLLHDVIPAAVLAQQDMFEGFTDGLLVLDASGRIRGWNTAYATTFRLGKDPRIRGHGYSQHVGSMGPSMDVYLLDASQWALDVVAGKAAGVERRRGFKDPDSRMYLEAHVQPLEEGGWRRGWVLRFQDRSPEWSRKDDEIRDMRRALVSTFTLGFAHELNNPLSILSGVVQSLDEFPEDFDAAECSEMMRPAVKDASGIVSSLLRYAERSADDAGTSVPVLSTIQSCERILSTGGSVKLSLDVDPEDLAVICTEYDLLESLLQVVRNALAAQKETGVDDEITITAIRSPDNGGRVAISISDSGGGIPHDVMASIEDPFFSTRTGEGARGLGIPMVRAVLERHGGTLGFDVAEGKGTKVTITLPGAEADTVEPGSDGE